MRKNQRRFDYSGKIMEQSDYSSGSLMPKRHAWQHFVAAVNDKNGRLFGVQFTSFRMNNGEQFFCHCALTDVQENKHIKSVEGYAYYIDATNKCFSVQFNDVNVKFHYKGLTLHEYPSETSLHFGHPRMDVTGWIRGEPVTGVGCYDAEQFDKLLKPDERGWLWQVYWLDDGRTSVYYGFCKKDGNALSRAQELCDTPEPCYCNVYVKGEWPETKHNAAYEESLCQVQGGCYSDKPIGIGFIETVPFIDL